MKLKQLFYYIDIIICCLRKVVVEKFSHGLG